MELEVSPPESMACDSACGVGGFIPAVSVVKRKRTTRRRRTHPAAPVPDISSRAAPADDATAAASGSVTEEEADTANCLILLAQGRGLVAGGETGVYECTSCNKSFPSFQALGGHRAGHKKLKLANTDEDGLIGNNASSGTRPGAKTHECAVCGSEFSSGQALGGHMRRHRAPATAASSCCGSTKQRSFFSLDLNLPAPADEEEEEQRRRPTSPAFTFIVGASTLVDCHY